MCITHSDYTRSSTSVVHISLFENFYYSYGFKWVQEDCSCFPL